MSAIADEGLHLNRLAHVLERLGIPFAARGPLLDIKATCLLLDSGADGSPVLVPERHRGTYHLVRFRGDLNLSATLFIVHTGSEPRRFAALLDVAFGPADFATCSEQLARAFGAHYAVVLPGAATPVVVRRLPSADERALYGPAPYRDCARRVMNWIEEHLLRDEEHAP